jgi:hypothetical protein
MALHYGNIFEVNLTAIGTSQQNMTNVGSENAVRVRKEPRATLGTSLLHLLLRDMSYEFLGTAHK